LRQNLRQKFGASYAHTTYTNSELSRSNSQTTQSIGVSEFVFFFLFFVFPELNFGGSRWYVQKPKEVTS
jgi:hypothetical protein